MFVLEKIVLKYVADCKQSSRTVILQMDCTMNEVGEGSFYFVFVYA